MANEPQYANPVKPILSPGARKRHQNTQDRRMQKIFQSEHRRAMQGILTDDGMLAGESIQWDPSVPADTGGTMGGDLDGGLPRPKVTGIQDTPVSNVAPNPGDTLIFNGMEYVPGPAAASGQYRSHLTVLDGSLGWNWVDVDDGTGSGQRVPVTALWDLE